MTDTYYIPDVSTIRNHRLRAQLTQRECAKACCVTQVTWSRWEKGVSRMPAGLWKLFLIEVKYPDEANEAKSKIPSTTLQTMISDWDEDTLT
jgi:transcriptional regulator with XRE-family HTH domain